MNFYKHHLGDYAKKTDHLSWDEDCAYTRMLRVYYKTERPLPRDPEEIYRLIRAIRANQKGATWRVLTEFFFESPDGWRNTRADEEIERAKVRSSINSRIAAHRESTKRARSPHESVHLARLQTPDSRNQIPDSTPLRSASGGQRGVGTFKKVGAETLTGNGLARIPERHAKTTDELEREEAARAVD